MVVKYFFGKTYMSRNNSRNCSCMLFVNGADDGATTCVFFKGCWEVNGTAPIVEDCPNKKDMVF